MLSFADPGKALRAAMWTFESAVFFKPFTKLDCKNSSTNATSKEYFFPSENERKKCQII